ncbi:MAG: CHAD domain-containing protein [Planctomycetota bacterium]|nr:MAG: CHAD domain-containing protein [Planctomycetota bacterium]
MAYRILPGELVQEGIQRIAREQIDKAIDELDDDEVGRHETVHQVRKRCKKIRGLIRLVRPKFEATYKRENAWYRDAARPLSYVRDAQALVETFDDLTEHFQDQIDEREIAEVRRELTDRRRRIAEDEVGLRERLDKFRELLLEGRERVAAWRIKDDEFDAVEGGLRKTYARGRMTMRKAFEDPQTESFHEWRKRTKYHWYHMRLLRLTWEGPQKARRDAADLLSDLLGDDHDLSILRRTLLERPDNFGEERTIQSLIGLINQRQVELRTQARTLGARIYAEKEKHYCRRQRIYWKAWRRETDVRPKARHAPELVTA